MGHIIKWGVIGFFGILILTMIFTPFLCSTISIQNPEVSCNAEDNINIFLDIYSTYYAFILLTLGVVLGMLIGRVISLVDTQRVKLSEQIYKKEVKNKKFLWMWEHK